jgi:hypothetical protein
MERNVTQKRIAWSLADISEATGLSLGFLRNDVRRGALRIKKFGRRVLVLDSDLRAYLNRGEPDEERLTA